jgi:PAB-dependent poly(A)-specific ribonuclease subunit 2
VLAVNASVYNEDNMKLWLDNRQSRFLSPSVEVRGEVDGVDEAMGVVYELRVSCFFTCCSCAHLWFVQAMVVQIMTKERHSHLVAIVKGELFILAVANAIPTDNDVVPEAESRPNLKSAWFLFNDFVVRNISEEEALSFPSTWKVSCDVSSVH